MRNKAIVWGLLFICSVHVSFAQRSDSVRIHDFHYSDKSINTIHCEVYGEGSALLIINGGPGMNSQGFRWLAHKIGSETNNSAIIYDQRGTGASTLQEVSSNSITMDSMVFDIEQMRIKLGVKSWTVLGHSFGGMLASYYTSKHPDNVTSLILSSSGGIDLTLLEPGKLNVRAKLTSVQQDSLDYWSGQINRGDTTYQARFNRGKYLAPAYLFNKTTENINVIADRLTQSNMRINGLVFQNMQSIEFDCKSELKKYKKPVLIIQGKNDILDTSLALQAHGIFPNSQLLLLDQCAHYGWIDRPEAFFNTLYDFLDKVNKT